MDIRQLTDAMAVAPQLDPGEMADVAARGFTAVINNRPDGEVPGQPTNADVAAAATAAGLAYHFIPVTGNSITEEAVNTHKAAMDAAAGPVLAFCRSGNRSSIMWALAVAGDLPPADIIARGAKAGYDLSGLAAALEARANQ